MSTIVYISNAIQLFEEEELEELFVLTKSTNTLKDITGILFYRDGTFMQILEGRKSEIEELFERIQQDARHNNITKILKRNVDERLFTSYQTGFSVFKNYKELDRLESFLKQHNNSSHAQTILALLTPFLNERRITNSN